MEPKTLLAVNHVDLESGCLFRHVKSETEYFRPHDHDYFEIFLTLGGEAVHYVNGHYSTMTRGYLIFIRDFDLHDYKCSECGFELLNLAFTRDTLESMFDYLGEGIESKMLLTSPLPPQTRLSDSETDRLHMKLAELNTVNFADKAKLKLKMRTLLAEIFTTYFCNLTIEDSSLPFWLENACEKMKSPKNFIVGKERFFDLCGRTREHSTRSLQKYCGLTPSDFVNDLRLNYAANLLLASNLSATDVCYECGFKNLSWFYTEFEGKFGVSPIKYREETGIRTTNKKAEMV